MSLYRKVVTRPLPAGATVVDGIATWRDRRGKPRKAPVIDRDGSLRIRDRSKTWYGEITLANGGTREVATGCTDRQTAATVVNELVRRELAVRGGVMTRQEADAASHGTTTVADATAAYIAALAKRPGKGAKRQTSPAHVRNSQKILADGASAAGFVYLRDLDRDRLTQWAHSLANREPAPAPRTINAKLACWSAFGTWLEGERLVASNPFARLKKLSETGKQRQRRSLKPDEISRLLEIARLRPVAEKGRASVKLEREPGSTKRSSWALEPLSIGNIHDAYGRAVAKIAPDLRARLDRDGEERSLVYRALISTGLRKGELSAITVGNLQFAAEPPTIDLPAEFAKNGIAAAVAVAADLAKDLAAWAAGRLPDEKIFTVPTGLLRILERDLAAAGIAKIDDRGRRLDVHSMRMTCGTLAHAAGVPTRTIQAHLRHSTSELTERTYCDESLLPVDQAAEAAGSFVAGTVAGERPQPSESEAVSGTEPRAPSIGENHQIPAQRRAKPTVSEKRAKGLEPSTSSLGTAGGDVCEPFSKVFFDDSPVRCRAGCSTDDARRARLLHDKRRRTRLVARVAVLLAELPISPRERVEIMSHALGLIDASPEAAEALQTADEIIAGVI